MFWLGKLLGALFGYMIAGPYGAVFGLLLGHYFDISRKGHWFFFEHPHRSQTQDIFFQSTFTIMGYIAKSDGRVSEDEIRAATRIMQNMLLTPHLKQQAILYFQQGKRADFNLEQILDLLYQNCFRQPNLLHLFVDIQLQAAYAEGTLTLKKRRILEYICQRLSLNPQDFFQRSYRYEHAHRQSEGQQYQHYQRQQSYQQQRPPNTLEKAYRILGISSGTNNGDLKKAYRKLMSKNHPDKLVSKGLPEEMIKLATQRTQEIKSAYETICKARGI